MKKTRRLNKSSPQALVDCCFARPISGLRHDLSRALCQFGKLRRLLIAALVLTTQCALANDGIHFACAPAQVESVAAAMQDYLQSLQIDPALLVIHIQPAQGMLSYTLATPENDTNTLDLHQRPALQIRPERIALPAGQGKFRSVLSVSQKEILLALMQHGRLTEFAGKACDVAALKDAVEIRQNIVAWAEQLNWIWPNGGSASWNEEFWLLGTPRRGVRLSDALQDAFNTQDAYAIGCYTAIKLVIAQGVVDYFDRIKASPVQAALVNARLHADDDPLVDIEPPNMWSFEMDFDLSTARDPGKLVELHAGIAARNFVPGDWAYLRNTDSGSARKIGYEGSNSIYLGRNRFTDLYNDNDHTYTYHEKLDEVFQWRHGVFSRARDFKKIRKLSAGDYRRLGKTPHQGGLVMDIRATPYQFGFDTLPRMSRQP